MDDLENFYNYVRNRGISEEVISYFKEENIDMTVAVAMGEEKLKNLIPKYGDRIAILEYCKRQLGPKKNSLIDIIKNKISLKGKTKSDEHISGNKKKVSQKTDRYIELGWLCSTDEKKIIQVRSKQGGGTRKVAMKQNATMAEVKNKAIELFFPNNTSPKENLNEFQTDLLDFKHNEVKKEWTIAEIYDITKLTRLRFYLSTVAKQSNNKLNSANKEKSRRIQRRPKKYEISSDSDFEESQTRIKISRRRDIEENDVNDCDENPAQSYLFSFLNDDNYNEVNSIQENNYEEIAHSDNLSLLTETYNNVNVEKDFELYRSSENVTKANTMNICFIPTLPEEAPTENIMISRNNCLDSLFKYYSDDKSTTKKLSVAFLDEDGVDGGGLTREMFSLFFNSLENQFFKGEDCMVPFLPLNRVRKEREKFIFIGRAIEHMILLTGQIPSKLSEITLTMIANSDALFDEKILLDNFLSYVNPCERSVVKKAINDFQKLSEKEKNVLTNMFNAHQFFDLPSQIEIKEQILTIASDVLIDKPKQFIEFLRKGISLEKYGDFWKKCDFSVLLDLQKPTPDKVINCLKTPTDLTNEQATILHYLEMYIRCMDCDTLRQFLLYVTGSCQMPDVINVDFNEFVGLMKRPVVSTCSNLIQLSTTYNSYQELKKDLQSCLLSEEAYAYNTY